MTDRHRRAPLPAETWMPLEAVVSKDIFKAEVAAWEKRLRVEPREVHVRPMRRKWGSCSTSGRVTFNAELLSESAAFRKRWIRCHLARSARIWSGVLGYTMKLS